MLKVSTGGYNSVLWYMTYILISVLPQGVPTRNRYPLKATYFICRLTLFYLSFNKLLKSLKDKCSFCEEHVMNTSI